MLDRVKDRLPWKGIYLAAWMLFGSGLAGWHIGQKSWLWGDPFTVNGLFGWILGIVEIVIMAPIIAFVGHALVMVVLLLPTTLFLRLEPYVSRAHEKIEAFTDWTPL